MNGDQWVGSGKKEGLIIQERAQPVLCPCFLNIISHSNNTCCVNPEFSITFCTEQFHKTTYHPAFVTIPTSPQLLAYQTSIFLPVSHTYYYLAWLLKDVERILEKDPITGTKIPCHIWIKTINEFFHLILQALISIRDFCLGGFVLNLNNYISEKERITGYIRIRSLKPTYALLFQGF